MAEARKKLKSFDGRAATLLKQTNELATLCDSPACIVIYNPDDVNRPCRIWPDNESDFRSIIQMYKTTKKRKRHATVKTNPSRRRLRPTAAAGVDVASSIPNPIGANEFFVHQSTPQVMDPTSIQARFPPLLPAPTPDRNLVLAGNVETWAGNVEDAYYQIDSIATASTADAAYAADVVRINQNTSIAADGGVVGLEDTDFDQLLLSCDWDDSEMFEFDKLLNSSDDQAMMMMF